jgi:hypothetical protein
MSPLAAATTYGHARAPGQGAVAAGVVYGGLTSQRHPIVLEVSRNGREVVRAAIAIRLQCTSGGGATVPDGYTRLTLTAGGRFRASFGPNVTRNDDGTTTDWEGSVRGAFNASRTRASGTWQLQATDRDAAGAVTDTCNSGSIAWRAKQ